MFSNCSVGLKGMDQYFNAYKRSDAHGRLYCVDPKPETQEEVI